MRRAHLSFVAVATVALAGGCSDAPVDLPPITESESPIINGQLDTTHQAVVAVLGGNSACTGTIIDVQPPYAFVLTAAHCVDDPPQVVRQGDDYDSGSAIQYNVQEYLAHPGYNDSVNDFAMLRVTGASASTPVMAVMTPAEDNITDGRQCTHVGYGVTQGGNNPPNNSQRRRTTGIVVDTTSLTLTFNGMSSGVCFGDSGGPNIDNTTGKVAGVNSSVSTGQCNGYSFSGRASAVLNSFIIPFINNAPPPPVDCDGCFEAATTGTGDCMGAVNACFNNSTCEALVSCFNGCTTQTCINNCANTHSGGLDLYNAIFDCVCDSACMTECESASMCQGGGGGPPTTTSVAQSSVAADAAATAGVGGAGGAGAGGAPPTTGAGWFPGNAENADPDGVLLTSGCGFRGTGSRDASWIALALALGGLARRRRGSA